jgi:hypothetical protein
MLNKKLLPLQVLQSRLTEGHLDSILTTLDRLHDAAATDNLELHSALSAEQLVGWLEDIIYTAQETIRELGQETATEPVTGTILDFSAATLVGLYRRQG